MTHKLMSATVTLLALMISATPVVARAAEGGSDLPNVMKKNFEAISELQQYVVDAKKFSDPDNRKKIQELLDQMSGLKHVFPQKMAEAEPGLAAISTLFSDYLTDIQKAFHGGASGSFVRNQIRTMTGFCLSCHTRVGTSSAFTDAQSKIESSSSLTPVQKAEFYAATRQFDKAIQAFDDILSKTPSGELGLMDFGRSVRSMLSITVRVKQDPKATFYFLERMASRKDLPDYFQRYLSTWKTDVTAWMKEKKPAKDAKPEVLVQKASQLIQAASKRQLFAVDPSGDIQYLRATNLIHEALQKNPKGVFRGEALYQLGTCYDALQDPLLWALDSLYFEACIREFPHSQVSKKCYKRYATKLYFGYSGSGGTYVPEDELKKLADLRKLSE